MTKPIEKIDFAIVKVDFLLSDLDKLTRQAPGTKKETAYLIGMLRGVIRNDLKNLRAMLSEIGTSSECKGNADK